MNTLYYVADPMCSWCFGFAPQLDAIRAALPADFVLEFVMGGLAPDSDEPMPDDMRAYVQNAWREVAARTGATFNWEFFERCTPRRSTYPACRAVLAAAEQEATGAMFDAIQRAYYREARNPSDNSTLIELAGELGLDASRFTTDLGSERIEARLQAGFALRRRLGANTFPSLVLDDGAMLLRGYGCAEEVIERLSARGT